MSEARTLPLRLSWQQRRRIGDTIEWLVALLDAAAPDADQEEETDGCEAADDDPAGSHPHYGIACQRRSPGEPDDAEEGGDDESSDDFEPSEPADPNGAWLESAAGQGVAA